MSLEPDAVERMVETARTDPAIAAVGAKLLEWYQPEVLQEVGAAIDRYAIRRTALDPGEVDSGQRDDTTDVLFCSDACLLVRRDAFIEIGGLDAKAWPFYEDVDLCWRLRAGGARVVVEPQARVRHAADLSGGRRLFDSLTLREHAEHGRLRFMLKHYALLGLLVLLPQLMIAAFARLIAALFRRELWRVRVIVRAWARTLRELPGIMADRRRAPKARVEDYEHIGTLAAAADESGLRSESTLLAQAFATLPERWQTVLWHTSVEDDSTVEVGRVLGITPSAVAALAYRAREGLRQAYLSAHIADTDDPSCQQVRENLAAYSRDRLGARDTRTIEEHLDGCSACRAVLADLRGITSDLPALLIPALLGSSGLAIRGRRRRKKKQQQSQTSGMGVGSAGSGARTGFVRTALQRTGPVRALAAVAAVAVVCALTVISTRGSGTPHADTGLTTALGGGDELELVEPAAPTPTPSPTTDPTPADEVPPPPVQLFAAPSAPPRKPKPKPHPSADRHDLRPGARPGERQRPRRWHELRPERVVLRHDVDTRPRHHQRRQLELLHRSTSWCGLHCSIRYDSRAGHLRLHPAIHGNAQLPPLQHGRDEVVHRVTHRPRQHRPHSRRRRRLLQRPMTFTQHAPARTASAHTCARVGGAPAHSPSPDYSSEDTRVE